jgi:hypothetical protein
MKSRSVKWLLAGLGIAIAAGVAGMVIAAVRCGRPVVAEDTGTETLVAERELQPAS